MTQPKVEVFLYNETIWLTQKRMAELFGVDRTVITKHLNNIFISKELDKNSVCAKIAHTAEDGKSYQTTFTMEELAESINEFLKFNRYEILKGKGNISHKKAEEKAFNEYEKFNKTQKIESDFDREVKKILKE